MPLEEIAFVSQTLNADKQCLNIHISNFLFYGQSNEERRSITCKYNARWLHVSQLKTSTVYDFQKAHNVDISCQLKPGKGVGIW